jgi:hypothetical protein
MKTIFTLALLISILSAPTIVQADNEWQSWPLADRFTIALDAFSPYLDTRVRVDASDESPGTTIDFEQNLGLSDTETLPALGLGWRFAKKHQLSLEYFRLDRSGSSITVTDIRIGDDVFSANLPISFFFDMKVSGFHYSYSLIFDERKELALSVGLSIQDLSFGLIGNAGLGVINAESGITAPLPTFGLNGGYAFTDKWIGKIGIGVFSFDLSLEDEDELSGEVFNSFLSIQHNTFEHVHFGLSYNYFDVRVDWKESGLITSVGYKYHGPMLTVTAAF